MRKVRLLLLDDPRSEVFCLYPALEGVQLDILTEDTFGILDTYSDLSLSASAEIRRLTTTGQVDLVVIGNNLGSGVAKAECVADEMKSRTVIMWNHYTPGSGKVSPYESLGFTHFAPRRELSRVLAEILAAD